MELLELELLVPTWEAASRRLRQAVGGIWGNAKQELRTCWVPWEWSWPSLANISVNLRNNRKGGSVTVCTVNFQEVRPQHHWYWYEWLAEPARTGRSQSNDNSSYSQGALQGICASCGALTQRLLFCLDTEMTQGHSRQEQERSDDGSNSLTDLMNGYNGTQSKQGRQLPQKRCWRVSKSMHFRVQLPTFTTWLPSPSHHSCQDHAFSNDLSPEVAGDLRCALHTAVKSSHFLCSGGAGHSVGYIAWYLSPGPRNWCSESCHLTEIVLTPSHTSYYRWTY